MNIIVGDHRLRVAIVVLAIAGALPRSVVAQTPPPTPGAGSTLREITPPPPLPQPSPTIPEAVAPPAIAPRAAGPSFVLRSVRFTGATVYSDAELQSAVADRVGQSVTFADLEAIAQRVAERYRAAGFPLAQAVVPAQDVSAGAVDISILEGRVGQVRIEVDPAAPARESQVRGYAARIAPGQPLREDALERTMLLLSDLPGVRAGASLIAGEAVGSTDLDLAVTPRRSWDLAFDADNHGSRATSTYRAGVQGRWNSPLRVGDNLDYRVQLGSDGGLTFGRVGYELPVGYDGLRMGVAYSHLQYELGKEFEALDAKGTANAVDFAVTYPWIRSRAQNLFVKFLLQQKLLEDRFDAIQVVNDKRIRAIGLGLNYEGNDRLLGGGYTSAGLNTYVGILALKSAQQRSDDQAFRKTEGNFTHWNYNLARLNALTAKTSVFIGVAGQFSNKNLDSAEKIALGGPRGVRAYAPSEATADEGHILNAELRYSPIQEVSLQGFYDWGLARLNHSTLPVDTFNKVILRGYGVGVFWGAQNGFSLRASLAWRGSARGVAEPEDRRPRLYVQIGKSL